MIQVGCGSHLNPGWKTFRPANLTPISKLVIPYPYGLVLESKNERFQLPGNALRLEFICKYTSGQFFDPELCLLTFRTSKCTITF